MKTKKDYAKINYRDYAFFKGIAPMEAKWEFAELIFPDGWHEDQEKESVYFTLTGNPKIKIDDLVDSSKLDFTMRSNSKLDGQSQLEYLCDYYNKGLPVQKLREHSENPTFRKAIAFSGKMTTANDILNREQLRKLQRTWILSQTYYKITDKAIEFVIANDWALEYIVSEGVSMATFMAKKENYLEEKKSKK